MLVDAPPSAPSCDAADAAAKMPVSAFASPGL